MDVVVIRMTKVLIDRWIAVIIMITLIFLALFSGYLLGIDDRETCDLEEVEMTLDVNTNKTPLMDVLERIEKRNYTNSSTAERLGIPKYNCVNFSKDAAKELNKHGIKVRQVSGCKHRSGKDCHQWISIDFEPQTANPVDYSDEYTYFNEIK